MRNKNNVLFYMLFGVCLLLGFQNCSAPLEEDQQSLNSNDAIDETPFAFDTKVDSISYMSCAVNSSVDEALYSFRLGSFLNNSGLGLTTGFLNNLKTNNANERKKAILASSNNKNLQIQFAIRPYEGTDQPLLQRDAYLGVKQAFGPLGNEKYIDQVAQLSEGQRIRFFNRAPGLLNRQLEASFPPLPGVGEAIQYRQVLFGNGSRIITQTYWDSEYSSDPFPFAADLADAGNRAYGNGFKLAFEKAQSGADAAFDRVLSRITEVDLATRKDRTDVNWSCPTNLRLKIVRLEDWQADKTLCPVTNDPPRGYYKGSNGEYSSNFEYIRRVLDPEFRHWNIFLDANNPDRNCIVTKAKTDSCYRGVSSGATIVYDNSTCDDQNSGEDRCAHFVSFCVKQ